MPASWVILLLAVVSSPVLSTFEVTGSVNFDFAWRFSVAEPFHCDLNDFTYSYNDMQCNGLNSKLQKSADDCRDACCNDFNCIVWQYNDSLGCFIGQSKDCQHPSKGWVGGGRDPPKPPTQYPKQAAKNYDDSEWEIVDVPHDGLINGTYDQNSVEGHGYLPIRNLWYRKHFSLPSDWEGQSIWVEFQGVFRYSSIYLNGKFLRSHDSGYTTFQVRLDNASLVYYGDGTDNVNVIAVEVIAYVGYTGWWYEGGGIYRHVRLLTTDHVHFVVSGIYGQSKVVSNITDHVVGEPSKGQYADVDFYPEAEVYNENLDKSVSVMVVFNLIDEDGNNKGSVSSETVTLLPDQFYIFKETIPKIPQIELWSLNRPYLYKLTVSLISTSDNSVIESSTVVFGVRETRWDPNTAFFLNGKSFKWRGFNNHNSFTGVGVAVPDRINLFRSQMMRAVGANSWRMSHNPPVPLLLDILDQIGIVVWDENRNFGPNSIWLEDQRDMVKRDRNHPSIMVWSFCNEAGCATGDAHGVAERFMKISKQMDPQRSVSANMLYGWGHELTEYIDVQGLSHQSGSTFESFHKQFPKKPLIGSECCSCTNQRGEDYPDPGKRVLGSFNGQCNQEQTGNQLNLDFVAGCMSWTLFDYYGEPYPYGWPMVSSSFGSIDLAGFAKPSAYWYRTWYYYGAKSNNNGYDVPMNPPSLVNPYSTKSEENLEDGYTIHIVQSWEYFEGKPSRTIQAYTNAEKAELVVNGQSFGNVSVNWHGWAEWTDIPFTPGKITANAFNAQKEVKASHTVETAGAAVKVVAAVDAPSEKTGTGSMLVLNGQDAGLISAAIVDSAGRVVPSSSALVTFRIVSGPGRIIGVGNGNPSCQEFNQVPHRSAYHGLARAVVQVTEDSASSPIHRKLMMQIDQDGGYRTRIVPPGEMSYADAIVVEVSAGGLESSTISIPVTSDDNTHGVLASAKRSI